MAEEKRSSLEAILDGLKLPKDVEPRHFVIQKDANMTSQQMVSEIMRQMADTTTPAPAAVPAETEGKPSVRQERIEAIQTISRIDRDPYQQLRFAEKLIGFEEKVLEICQRMHIHLEEARPCMNGSDTWLTLIDQMIESLAYIKGEAGKIAAVGQEQKTAARALIEAIDSLYPFK